ncbi:precorrin-6Y C5,15-methyltransferase (Decarboxylating), CbiT subunit [groundwater metagenome]
MRYPQGTPTQPEIIAVALSKIELKPADVFADTAAMCGAFSTRAKRWLKRQA